MGPSSPSRPRRRATPRTAHRLLLPIVLAAAAGCARGDAPGASSAAAGAAPDTADASSAEAAIRRQSRRFSDAYVRGDTAALLAIYAPGAVAAPGERDFVRGRPALDSLWVLPAGRTVLRHVSTPVEIRVSGDQAYDWGYYEGQAARGGVPLDPFRGKYVIVWVRGDDGVWRIAVDAWTRLPAATGA